jgi:bacillolysin/neutral peptidase B
LFNATFLIKDQSGALNESFSDIFGIIIANWDPQDPDRDVSSWTWQLGAGLGEGGGPLRDLSNPRVTGDPDHMQDFLRTKRDSGGVHTNSNIHNKAAYNVLTATDAHGRRVFRPMEAADSSTFV